MNKLITFSGGKRTFNIDDVMWNDDAYRLAITAILKAFGGDDFIVQGCNVFTGTMGIGYIMLDGELLQVESHTKTDNYFVKVTTYDTGGDVTFIDGTPRQTWAKNRATCTASSGTLIYSSYRGIIQQKIFEIGTWDMDTNDTVSITHGLSISKIVGVRASIISDITNDRRDFVSPYTEVFAGKAEGAIKWNETNIILSRLYAGYFDSASFNGTENRGFVIVDYL